MDHAYMLTNLHIPPDPLCQVFSFIVSEFLFAQTFMVGFTALNAFLLVAMGKKVGLGRFDWKLVVLTFGAPLVLDIIYVSLGFLGPGEFW